MAELISEALPVHCTVLCAALCCTALYSLLFSTVLHCNVTYWTVVNCTLFKELPCSRVQQYSVIRESWDSMLNCVKASLSAFDIFLKLFLWTVFWPLNKTAQVINGADTAPVAPRVAKRYDHTTDGCLPELKSTVMCSLLGTFPGILQRQSMIWTRR